VIGLAALAFAAAAAPLELTLERAVALAREANPAIVSASLSARSDAIGIETSRSEFDLKIQPSTTVGRIASNTFAGGNEINASVGVRVARRFETGTALSLGPSFNRTAAERNTTLNFSLEQPLVRGWDRAVSLDGLHRAQFTADSSLRGLARVRDNVVLETVSAYYGVLRERSLASFAHAQRDRIERHARIAESKERAGVIGPMDGYRAAIRLKDAEDAANQADSALKAAQHRLCRAMNLPLDTVLALHPPGEAQAPAPARVESDAMAFRHELAQLRAERDEALRQAEVARKRILPEVTLQVGLGQQTHADPFLVQFLPTTQRQWTVSLQSSSDLDRSAEKNAWRQSLLRVDSISATLDSQVEEVRRQVREHVQRLAEAHSRIALRVAQSRQAEARLALAQVKFAHDMASNLDVLEAEGELQRAEASLATARAELAVGTYELLAMSGRLQAAFP
jgi:outer membrane protein